MKYICLLRGINVGGNNIIKMADLRDSLARAGFEDVQTYIQSGNIIFEYKKLDPIKIADIVTEVIFKDFQLTPPVLVLTIEDLKTIMAELPEDFGNRGDKFREDVIFLLPGTSPKEVLLEIETKEGIDFVSAGSKAIYFSRLGEKSSQSRMNRVMAKPAYKLMTIRNLRTTNKIAEMAGL